MLNKILLALSVVVFSSSLAFSEVIHLKSGRTIEAPIVTKADEYVQIDTGVGVVVTYYYDEIEKILDTSAAAHEQTVVIKKESKPKSPETALPRELERKLLESKKGIEDVLATTGRVGKQAESKVESQVVEIGETIDRLSKDFPGEFGSVKMYLNNYFKSSAKKFAAKINHLTMILKIFPDNLITAIIVTWMICAPLLFFIAKQMGDKQPWLAMMPVVQLFLLIRLAGKSTAWVLHFIIPLVIIIIPFFKPVTDPLLLLFIGVFWFFTNFLVVPMVLWMSILRLLQKPFLLGILMAIPGPNVLLHLYLAVAGGKTPQAKTKVKKNMAPKKPWRPRKTPPNSSE